MLFVADVVQGTMDDMEAAEFKRFLASLVAHATRSPVAILASTITFGGMFPYWYFYGFNNLWFTVGLILWVITSAVSKQMSLPIYSRVTGRKFPAYKARPEIDAADAAALEKGTPQTPWGQSRSRSTLASVGRGNGNWLGIAQRRSAASTTPRPAPDLGADVELNRSYRPQLIFLAQPSSQRNRTCLVNANDTTYTNGRQSTLDGCLLLGPQSRQSLVSASDRQHKTQARSFGS